MNLLTNAVKYTESGSVTLRVRNNGITDGNAKLRFEVEDTGIGIKKEDQAKLFNEFTQVDNRKNRKIQGTGLGLSIAKEILDKNGGSIDIKSVVGQGTEVVIKIPTKQEK